MIKTLVAVALAAALSAPAEAREIRSWRTDAGRILRTGVSEADLLALMGAPHAQHRNRLMYVVGGGTGIRVLQVELARDGTVVSMELSEP